MSFIRLENISKEYGKKENRFYALNGVSVAIEKGEMVAVMGPSGSGKSTFLNILGMIDDSSSGKVFIDDVDVSGYNDKKKSKLRNSFFGFVMQDFALIPHYKVYENVILPLEYRRIKKKEKLKKADELLDIMKIKNKREKYPEELSGGQKQRVAIARALINDAEVLLCDEPTGALDSHTTGEIMDIFTKLHEQGKTIIIVTHDIEVAKYCDRTIYIDDGKIVDVEGENQ